MVSIILTAWKEENTVGTAVEAILSQVGDIGGEFELMLVCPDDGTYQAARQVVEAMGHGLRFLYIKDPQKGKPYALNVAREEARGEVIVSTDGDVQIEEGALKALLAPFSDGQVGGVTGRPVCSDGRDTKWGYWGNMFIDAAHERRLETLGRGEFFVMSGYLLAVKNIEWQIPDGVLDDVYLSYYLHSEGYKISYAPEARVKVKQPGGYSDWMTQKVRSLAGHFNLEKHFEFPPESRTLKGDLRYALFPLRYAKGAGELWWSLIAYPFRLWTWMAAWWSITVSGKQASEIWERTESTK